MPNEGRATILIADSDFGEVDIERAIVEEAGLELVAAQCKSEDDVIEHGPTPTACWLSTRRWASAPSAPSRVAR